jgi:hypothetical protein
MGLSKHVGCGKPCVSPGHLIVLVCNTYPFFDTLDQNILGIFVGELAIGDVRFGRILVA